MFKQVFNSVWQNVCAITLLSNDSCVVFEDVLLGIFIANTVIGKI
jgi:hypothetical protein